MKNPWTTISTEKIYDNPWIIVEEDQVLTPNETSGIYGRVSFKNKAIGIIPLDDDGNTWLVGQYRYTLDEYTWEIPEGGGPEGETAVEAGKRELKEETGLVADKWTQIMRLHTSNSVTDEEAFIFLAEKISQQDAEPDHTEELRIKKLPFKEAVAMVMRGEITDAMSVAGILKLNEMLKKHT